MSSISPETAKWLEIAKTTPLPELTGLSGNLEFPRPTLEELCDLEYEPHKVSAERKLVIEAYEARLTHNQAAEDLYQSRQRALDTKLAELLSKK